MTRTIATSLLIAVPAARVWSVLLDFDAYPTWNPFIRSLKGKAAVGERLEVVIAPPGRKADTFRPVVIEATPEHAFRWRGSLPVPGLFTGEHSFELVAEAGGTLFKHSERFSGLLVPLVGSVLAATERGFRAMNEALKARSEGR